MTILAKMLLRAAPVCLAVSCLAQQPAFDAASVKLFDPATRPPWMSTGGPGTSDPGRIHLARASMVNLLTAAYGVEADQIAGGPAWARDPLGPNFYVVDATLPPDTTKEQYQLMLQHLLGVRFHLVVHHETRNFPGYELVVAKDGPKLQPSVPDPSHSGEVAPAASAPKNGLPPLPAHQCRVMMSSGTESEKCRGRSMAEFATGLGGELRMALGGDLSDPAPRVTDKTGLSGEYDFSWEFACAGCKGLRQLAPALAARAGSAETTQAQAPDGGGLPTIFAAIEKQLGLKLQKAKDVPVDVIVIDAVEKNPVGN